MSRADKSIGTASLPRDAAICLDALYRDHSRWLGAVLRRQLGRNAAEADDLVQETYVRIARYSPEDAGRSPKALLRRIAVNLARDHMRRTAVRGGPEQSIDAEPFNATLAGLQCPAEQEHDLLLKQVILGLPRRYREVFLLSRFTGMSYAEIGSHFGISVKTVEWRMSKALALCAERLRD